MNRRILSSVLAVAALCASPAHGAGKAQVVPKLALIGNPEFNATVLGMQPKRARPPAQGEIKFWLEFESDFDTEYDFPELTFKYGLLISMPGKAVKLIEGEVTHIDIAKGKDHHSVMYIAPKTLSKLAEGKGFSLNNIKAYWVEIVSQGEAVGSAFKSNAGVTYPQIMKEKDSLEKAGDSLLSKQLTPFAPLFIDYYEATKASR